MQCVERNIPFSVHTVLSDVNARGITELGDFLIGISYQAECSKTLFTIIMSSKT